MEQHKKEKGLSESSPEIPKASDIDIPPYPGAYLGSVMKSNWRLAGVMLLISDTPDQVIDWYRKHLKGWREFPNLAMKRANQITVFVETEKEHLEPGIEVMHHRQIYVQRITNSKKDLPFTAMMYDVSGIHPTVTTRLMAY